MLSCEIWYIFKNIYFEEYLRTTASKYCGNMERFLGWRRFSPHWFLSYNLSIICSSNFYHVFIIHFHITFLIIFLSYISILSFYKFFCFSILPEGIFLRGHSYFFSKKLSEFLIFRFFSGKQSPWIFSQKFWIT